MPTMHPSAEPLVPDKIPSQESPLSPEWTHAITTLMGHPLSSEPGKHIKKWIIYHRIHKYTMFALKWNPTQFKLDIHQQMYQEADGSLAYLKGHTVRKLVSLMKYMSLLIRQDRPDAQKHNLLYFISGNQLFRLTAHNMKSALINEKLENHGSQKNSSKRVKMIKPKPSWTSSTLCFGEPTLGNLNQVKLWCSISSRTLWGPKLAKSNQETELCITKHIPLCDCAGHTGIPFPTPRSSSETNRISNSHSSLVSTLSSRMILGKPKIEVTKVLTHNNGKNGEHFYGENWHNTTKNGESSNCKSSLVAKNLMNHDGRNGEHSCGPFNLNNTSCGFMLKEVDWGGEHPINSVVDWQRHETYPTGHNISEVDWGALHDSSFFLFLVNIDYDAKPKDFYTQEL